MYAKKKTLSTLERNLYSKYGNIAEQKQEFIYMNHELFIVFHTAANIVATLVMVR